MPIPLILVTVWITFCAIATIVLSLIRICLNLKILLYLRRNYEHPYHLWSSLNILGPGYAFFSKSKHYSEHKQIIENDEVVVRLNKKEKNVLRYFVACLATSAVSIFITFICFIVIYEIK